MAKTKGKNKKSSILLGIVYQPSPQIEKKMEGLDKIETMLSIRNIYSYQKGIIHRNNYISWRYNINVNEPSRSQKRYQEIL